MNEKKKKKRRNPIHELAKKNPPENRRLELSDCSLADALGIEDPKRRGVYKIIEGLFEMMGAVVSEVVGPEDLARASQEQHSSKNTQHEGIAVCKHGVIECEHCIRERKEK